MEKILESLYDQFYEKPELAALQASVKANHNLLRERLETERNWCLRIIAMRCHATRYRCTAFLRI